MDKSSTNLISPKAMGVVLMTVYASLFMIIPFFAVYKGWVYIVGCLFFGLGLRWQIEQICERGKIDIGLHVLNVRRLWDPLKKDEDRFVWWGTEIKVTSGKHLTTFVCVSLTTIALVILPIMVWVMGNQAVVLSAQIEQNSSEIVSVTEEVVTTANERFGMEIDLSQEGGLMSLVGQVAGDAINDVKNIFKSVLKTLAESVSHLFGDWLKVTIATFIVAAYIAVDAYLKLSKKHTKLIKQSFAGYPEVGNTIILAQQIFKRKIGQFMVGYLEVVGRLVAMFFVVIYILTPSGLGIWSAIGISIFLGFITAIPKIGGLIGMVIGAALMALNLKTGLGWFGFDMFSTGSAYVDTLIRMIMLGTIAKVIGLFEAYKFTPEIVGEKLGLDKIHIVFIVVMYAFGGFYWMIWGIIGLCVFATVMEMADEINGEKTETDSAVADEDAANKAVAS